ncbi:MAG TPA: hypothetical protein VKA46_37115 [Gemmataceae bacterium]|nr:hypothetical protein [Gemmataceae bacterium]
MWQSQVIREWKAAGRLEVQRNYLLRVLGARWTPDVPADLARTIEQITDLDLLTRWFDAALAAPTLDAFRSAMQPGSPPATQNS